MSDSSEENFLKYLEELKSKFKTDADVPEKNYGSENEAEAEEKRLVNLRQDEWEREKIQRLRDDNEARRNYGNAIFTVTVMWMFAVLCIVIESGRMKLKFSDSVLITLITTTTANVFGFFYVVVNYLFNKEKST